ncbi:hypothetical protein NK6_15 [Bradyrhizobium diazoefficiens]|uniref:Uncharacterized protein n=2 Tax=Bradyrhizobium diazoefficiens TaxID=1355477 RepID=A0A837CNJ5_9BRAD|nr:hypothetical protein BJA5080_06433 [Bradyrhizobium diazoefficiens SEMIA 5080]BAR53207.1 hypothetical protein NK6_15 [Bradyrhizobium diazoefficiens]
MGRKAYAQCRDDGGPGRSKHSYLLEKTPEYRRVRPPIEGRGMAIFTPLPAPAAYRPGVRNGNLPGATDWHDTRHLAW